MNEVVNEIRRLQGMTVGELRVRWRELYGEESRSRNRQFLWRRLAWRVQEIALGGLPDAAKSKIVELAPAGFVRSQVPRCFDPDVMASPTPRTRRDPRLPRPGSCIVRDYRGQNLRLLVLEDGFELDGVHYDSLSEATRAVTGQRWNGPLFWGLRTRSRRK